MHGVKTLANIKAWGKFLKIYMALEPEVEWLWFRRPGGEFGDATSDPFMRRLYVRSAFAYIEATTFLLKQCAISLAPGLLDPVQVANLVDEHHYALKPNGDIRENASKLRVAENILFAFGLFARAGGHTYEHDYKNPGWDCLLRAVEMRNRITHPREYASLVISDDEFHDMERAMAWFGKTTYDLLQLVNASVNALKKDDPALVDESGTTDFKEALAEARSDLKKMNDWHAEFGTRARLGWFAQARENFRYNVKRLMMPSAEHAVTATLTPDLLAVLDEESNRAKDRTGFGPTRAAIAGKLLVAAIADLDNEHKGIASTKKRGKKP